MRSNELLRARLLHRNGEWLTLRGDHDDDALIGFGLTSVPGHEHLAGPCAVSVTSFHVDRRFSLLFEDQPSFQDIISLGSLVVVFSPHHAQPDVGASDKHLGSLYIDS